MSLFDFPKPSKEPAMKGHLALSGRIHYLLTADLTAMTAVSACRKANGPVRLVEAKVRATCPDCVGLLMNRKVSPTIKTGELPRVISL